MSELKSKIIESLREVYDPEIPINIYDLGLIYEINIKKNSNVNILMSLTSPTCPTAEYIQSMIEDAIKSIDGVKNVDIELTFEPMWTPDRVSIEAREELGLDTDEGKNLDNLAIKNTFEVDSSNVPIKEYLCFNCATSDVERPIIACKYKKEDTYICSKCLLKF